MSDAAPPVPHPCHNEGVTGISGGYQGSLEVAFDQHFSGQLQVVGPRQIDLPSWLRGFDSRRPLAPSLHSPMAPLPMTLSAWSSRPHAAAVGGRCWALVLRGWRGSVGGTK
ncbi:MAG TPA: hypothetical protein VF711_05215, partial [Acidimicrobiales bacterium]